MMMMFMPLFSVYIGFITPGALGFYWTVSTAFQILQDILLTKFYSKKIEEEEALKYEERRKKEAEIEAKRIETEQKKAEGLVERNPNTSKRKKQKSDRQGQLDKATEWQKKTAPEEEEVYEPSRVGNRRYARGRAYDPDRYTRAAIGAIGEGLRDTDDPDTDDKEGTGHVAFEDESDSVYDDVSIAEGDDNDTDDEYEDDDESFEDDDD